MSDKTYIPQKTTLVLSNLHTAWLDDLSVRIRRRTGAAISRSSVVRAMIAAASQVPLDLSDCGCEEDIEKRVLSCLKSGHG